MATVEHASLSDPALHECKGASSATANQLLVATGSGAATWKSRLTRYNITISPALVAANTTAEQTFTCTGLLLASDVIVGVSKPTAQAGLGIVGWRVSANDQIAITFSNNTGVGITPTAAQTYAVVAWRD